MRVVAAAAIVDMCETGFSPPCTIYSNQLVLNFHSGRFAVNV